MMNRDIRRNRDQKVEEEPIEVREKYIQKESQIK